MTSMQYVLSTQGRAAVWAVPAQAIGIAILAHASLTKDLPIVPNLAQTAALQAMNAKRSATNKSAYERVFQISVKLAPVHAWKELFALAARRVASVIKSAMSLAATRSVQRIRTASKSILPLAPTRGSASKRRVPKATVK